MNKLLIVLSMLLGTNSIDGYVYDKNSGENLCGVKITTPNDTVFTDLNGYFMLKNISDSTNVRIELISYEVIDTTITMW